MRSFSLSLALPLAAALATPALAQVAGDSASAASDPAATAPASPPGGYGAGGPTPFTGLYVAASGGYDVQRNDVGSHLNFDRDGDGRFNENVTSATGANTFVAFCNGQARGTTLTANGGCANDRDRESYYGRVGFDVQEGTFMGSAVVLGALGEFGRTNIRDYTSGFSNTPNYYTFSRGVDWEASGRLRAGVARGIGLFYATGGVGYARLKHGFATSNTNNSFSTQLNDRDKFGYVFGGGVEVRPMKHISLGLEYTLHDYKDSQYYIRVTQGTAAATNAFVLPPYTSGTSIARSDTDFRWHSLRGVVGFHF